MNCHEIYEKIGELEQQRCDIADELLKFGDKIDQLMQALGEFMRQKGDCDAE